MDTIGGVLLHYDTQEVSDQRSFQLTSAHILFGVFAETGGGDVVSVSVALTGA